MDNSCTSAAAGVHSFVPIVVASLPMVCAGDGNDNGDGESKACTKDEDCDEGKECNTEDKRCESDAGGAPITVICLHRVCWAVDRLMIISRVRLFGSG